MEIGAGPGHAGGRTLKTRVKTARKRSLSSARWLERQLNDPYVARAKREGLRGRGNFSAIENAAHHCRIEARPRRGEAYVIVPALAECRHRISGLNRCLLAFEELRKRLRDGGA